jgi:diguanylate cyclase (GGDEF)-like protein/PAS domain S-box-containing protein
LEFSHLDSYTLLENLQTGVVVHDKNTKIRYANPKALELLRLSEAQVLGKGAFDPQWQFLDKNKRVIPVSDYPVNQVIASKSKISNIEVGICDSSSNKVTWVLCNAYPEYSEDKKLSQIIATFIDITPQKKDISFEDIVELANDIIIVTEADTSPEGGPKILYVNEAFSKITGYSKEVAIGQTPGMLQGEGTSGQTRKAIRDSLDKKSSIQAQILNYSKSGKPYWLDLNIFPLKNDYGKITHFAAIERDVTEQKNYENALRELSIRDPLTTLLNRRGFFEVAKANFDQFKRNLSPMVIAMIDIDFFKKINDKYGHDIGDLALQHISQLMQDYFRKSDIIARMGGEEFAILMSNSEVTSCLVKFENFLRYLAKHPLSLDSDETISFTISVGLTQMRKDAKSVSGILKRADMALYEAKHHGRNRVYISQL